jgi:proteasome lid subunit RPN8/RPN11
MRDDEPIALGENGVKRTLKYRINESTLVSMLDHAYADANNEILGLLGGHVDPDTHVVHITCTYSTMRPATEIGIDGVACADEMVYNAFMKFDEAGCVLVGWYHSHPRIPPFPSLKDLQTQLVI